MGKADHLRSGLAFVFWGGALPAASRPYFS